jgi:hypothetical protein
MGLLSGFLFPSERDYAMSFRKGSPVPATLRARMQRAIDAHGHMAVCRELGLSSSCFWRAVAGGPVHAGTVCQVERGLTVFE